MRDVAIVGIGHMKFERVEKSARAFRRGRDPGDENASVGGKDIEALFVGPLFEIHRFGHSYGQN